MIISLVPKQIIFQHRSAHEITSASYTLSHPARAGVRGRKWSSYFGTLHFVAKVMISTSRLAMAFSNLL